MNIEIEIEDDTIILIQTRRPEIISPGYILFVIQIIQLSIGYGYEAMVNGDLIGD